MSIRNLLSNAIRLGDITYRYHSSTQGDDCFVHLGCEGMTTEIRGKFGIVLYQGQSGGKHYMAAATGKGAVSQNTLNVQALYEILPDGKFKFDGSSQNEIPAGTPDKSLAMKSKSSGSRIILQRAYPEK